MRYIHLSDLHLGNKKATLGTVTVVKELIKDKEKLLPATIIITGDILDDWNGRCKIYSGPSGTLNIKAIDHAVEIIETLRDIGFRVFICPGNHDYGDSGVDFEDEAVSSWYNHFGHLSEFEVRKESGSNDVHSVVMMNSCKGFDKTFLAAGELGMKQIGAVDSFLKDNRHSVTHAILGLHHHPVEREWAYDDMGMELNDAAEFRAMCEENNVTIVFYGHKHGWAGTTVLNGVTYHNTGSTGFRKTYSIVEIDEKGIRTIIKVAKDG